MTDETNINVHGFKVNTGSGGASARVDFKLGSADFGSTNFATYSSTPISGDYQISSGTNGTKTGDGETVSTYYVVYNGTYKTTVLTVLSGVTVSNVTFYPMMRLASVSDATFAPYSNICPITGRASTSVITTDGTDTETASITFGQTVYAGTVNFNTGVVTVDKVAKTFTGAEGWSEATAYYALAFSDTVFGIDIPKANLSSGIICNMLVGSSSDGVWTGSSALAVNKNGLPAFADLAAFKTWLTTNNLQVCYELETPVQLTLTADELQMLKGDNSVTGDGVITITAYTGDPWPIEEG